MSASEPDWSLLAAAVAARRRPIMDGLADFLRLDTVSQKPDRVRAGADRRGDARTRARGPHHGNGWKPCCLRLVPRPSSGADGPDLLPLLCAAGPGGRL